MNSLTTIETNSDYKRISKNNSPTSLKGKTLTSAWPPELRVLLHFSHLKQGLCQSLPREVTFSAETQTNELLSFAGPLLRGVSSIDGPVSLNSVLREVSLQLIRRPRRRSSNYRVTIPIYNSIIEFRYFIIIQRMDCISLILLFIHPFESRLFRL